MAGNDMVESFRNLRIDGPRKYPAPELGSTCSGWSSSGVVTTIVIGTVLELSKRVEVLENEDFRPLVIVDFAGEWDRRKDRSGGLPSSFRESLFEVSGATGIFLVLGLEIFLAGSEVGVYCGSEKGSVHTFVACSKSVNFFVFK